MNKYKIIEGILYLFLGGNIAVAQYTGQLFDQGEGYVGYLLAGVILMWGLSRFTSAVETVDDEFAYRHGYETYTDYYQKKKRKEREERNEDRNRETKNH